MTLRDEAIALRRNLSAIVAVLEQVAGSEHPRELAAFLKPLVRQYDEAVHVTRSREQAVVIVQQRAK